MRGLFAFVLAGVVVALVIWTAPILLPACGAGNRIVATWADWCPVNKSAELERKLAALSDENSALEYAILQRERELALMQCAPDMPRQAGLPEKIDPQDWNRQRIGLLEGCWELDSRFVTTHRETGAESRYTEWTMCFDARGAGREEMRADNGNSCSGPVTGSFDGNGDLVIEEPANLQCSDGGYIYRLRSKCRLQDDGTASCAVAQPEVGSSTTVDFRRSLRGR